MSGECDKCGEHCTECTCKQKRPISVTRQWIDVNTKTPQAGKRVLATDGIWVEIMWYKGSKNKERNWVSLSSLSLDISHWMELPETPESED
jgi:hypothetical protein